MKKSYLLLTGILLIVISLASYRASLGMFSDFSLASKTRFSTADSFPLTPPISAPLPTSIPSLTPTPAAQVLINEVYNSTSGNENEWVELYNPNASAVDVSGWKIYDGADDVFPSTSILPAGGYGLVLTSNTTISVPSGVTSIQLNNNTIGQSGLSGSGDYLILRKSDNTDVDAVSWGTDSTIFSPQAPAIPANQSIARNPNGFDSNLGSDWEVDSTPTLGSAN